MRYRTCVVAIVQNDKGEYLLCKKPSGMGIYPGQWGLVGGGIDEGESMEEALRREINEEVGLKIGQIQPLYFRDDVQVKYVGGQRGDEIYMIYLYFSCVSGGEVRIDNREFEDFAWVRSDEIGSYDLNEATKQTFEKIGVLPSDQIHDEWVKYPVGTIPKGMFCSSCRRYNVRNTTAQVIVLRDGKVLLQQRNLNPEKGAWALIAGYLGWDETLDECIRREVMEEVGMELVMPMLVGVYSDPKRDKDGRQNVAVLYAGEVKGEIKLDAREVRAVKWFSLDQLPGNIAFDHRKMIDDYIAFKDFHA